MATLRMEECKKFKPSFQQKMQDQTDDYDGAFIKTLFFVIYKNRLYWFMHYKT